MLNFLKPNSYKKLHSVFISLFLLISNCLLSQISNDGLVLWLKADKGLVLRNDSVVQWQDMSGNDNNAVLSTPLPPQLIKNSVNNLPSICFNGKNNGFQTPIISNFKNRRGAFFVVLKINGRGLRSSVGAGNIISTYHGNGTAWQFASNPKGFSFYDGIGGEAIGIGEFSNSQWCLVSIERQKDSILNFSFNSKYITSFPIHNTLPDSNTLKIGYNGLQHFNDDDICECLNGEIAEIIIYNGQKFDFENVQNYLMNKYNIKEPPLPFYFQAWFIIFILAFITILIFYIHKSLQNIKIKKLLQQAHLQQKIDQERLRISQDMHDDLGSGLTKIVLISEILKSNNGIQNSDKANTISSIAKDLIDNLNHIVYTLKTEYQSLDNFIFFIRSYSEDFFGTTDIKLIKSFQDNIPNYILSGEQQRNIYLSLKEVFNNILKHSKASTVNIEMFCENKVLTIKISDNGVGMDISNLNRVNGIENIKSRILKINGICTYQSTINKGTDILIEVILI